MSKPKIGKKPVRIVYRATKHDDPRPRWACWDGKPARPPQAGELYLSGAEGYENAYETGAGMSSAYFICRPAMTAIEARQRIEQHLEKGGGIYATLGRECSRFYKVRVVKDELELWDGFSWFPVTRPAAFNNGEGSAGELFIYE